MKYRLSLLGSRYKSKTKAINKTHMRYVQSESNNSKSEHHNFRNKNIKPKIMNLQMVNQFLNWLCLIYDIDSKKLLLLRSLIKTFCHYEKHKGSKFLIKIIKEVRISLENYACSSDVLEGRLVRLNYSGLPLILKEAIHLFKQDDNDFKRLLFSLLTIGRTAIFDKCPDYSTITNKSTATMDIPPNIFRSFIQTLSKRIKTVKVIPLFQNYHFSVKASPLGDNCMESMFIELVALPTEVRNTIYKVGGKDLEFRMKFIISNFRKLSIAIPGFTEAVDKLIVRFKSSKDFIQPLDIYDSKDNFYTVFLKNYIRKLVSFAEYEGKTRIIGLCDY
jgi:hypothetical protein